MIRNPRERSSTVDNGQIAEFRGPMEDIYFNNGLPTIHELLVVKHGELVLPIEVHAELDDTHIRAVALRVFGNPRRTA